MGSLPLLPSLIEWWAELPHDRTTYRFPNSSITFTTWYVQIDPLDTGRYEYSFEIRDESKHIANGSFYSTFCDSPVTITKLEDGSGVPFGIYLTQQTQRFSREDRASLLLYDPASKTVAGQQNWPRESMVAPTGDAPNWPSRFDAAIKRHGIGAL